MCAQTSDFERMYEEAENYTLRHDYDSAILSYGILVDAYPDKTEAYLGRGNAYLERSDE